MACREGTWLVKVAGGSGKSGGGRWVDVPAERFPGWVASFAARHGSPAGGDPPGERGLGVSAGAGRVTLTAPDGSVAERHPPFPETLALPETLPPLPPPAPLPPGADPAAGQAAAAQAAELLAAHARAPRTVGVLLVRLGGYAAGVFTGYPPRLLDAKTGSRPVHGRSAAGGWSQQRFARRREKQANEALQAAVDAAVLVFGRWATKAGEITATSASGATSRGTRPASQLDAVVLGGDRRAMAELRGDPRLAPYLALATERFLTVPDPRRAVLEAAPRQFTAVRIYITEASS